jgi:hypothetical protein
VTGAVVEGENGADGYLKLQAELFKKGIGSLLFESKIVK